MLTLYATTLSANGRKALAVARHLNLNVNEQNVNVYAGEGLDEQYRSLNPWGKIPTLVDGDFVLWESNAILVYLAESYGDFLLSSRNAQKRADTLRWLFWESSHWQPVLSRILAGCVGNILFKNSNNESIKPDWNDPELVTLLSFLDQQLAISNYLSGDGLTLADFSVAGMTTYFRACGFPYSEYPKILQWLGRLARLPAWVSTEEPLWLGEG
jgi:glutathione S-transferase